MDASRWKVAGTDIFNKGIIERVLPPLELREHDRTCEHVFRSIGLENDIFHPKPYKEPGCAPFISHRTHDLPTLWHPHRFWGWQPPSTCCVGRVLFGVRMNRGQSTSITLNGIRQLYRATAKWLYCLILNAVKLYLSRRRYSIFTLMIINFSSTSRVLCVLYSMCAYT